MASLFQQKAPKIMGDLMRDFGLDAPSAAAIVGNLGHESGGFKFLQEKKPLIPGSRGGYGWAQWTGTRRRQYEAWVAAKGLDGASDEANYGFLVHELRTTESKAIPAIKRAVGLEAKVKAFELAFERAGVKHYPSRNTFARQALEAFGGAPAPSRKPRTDRMSIPAGKWAEDVLAPFEVEAIQKRLRDLGYYQVGKVDGKWGPSTKGAIIALQATAGIEQDGHWGPQTKDALADDKNRRRIDPSRARTTADDLRAQGSAVVIQSDRITWSGIVGLVIAIGGAAYQAWNAPADLPTGSSILLAFLPPSVAAIVSASGPFLLAFLPLAYNILQARGIVGARVEAERTGLHNGEPDPAPSPPVTASPDGPRPGGFFGRWLGQPY